MKLGEFKQLLEDWDETMEVVVELRFEVGAAEAEDGDILPLLDERSVYVSLGQVRIIAEILEDDD